jgi:hypothetical protein
VRESVHRRCICEVRELVLRLYMYVAHESAAHHHDGRVVHVLAHHRCTCAERELEPRLYMNAERELAHHRDVHDLLVRHHDGHVGRELVRHRCTCAERELGGHLHCDHEFHLAFRHLCAVVFRKDSKHHYCAWRHELRRAVIRRGYEHLDRVVHEVHEIRPLPPWNLAWHASWQQ